MKQGICLTSHCVREGCFELAVVKSKQLVQTPAESMAKCKSDPTLFLADSCAVVSPAEVSGSTGFSKNNDHSIRKTRMALHFRHSLCRQSCFGLHLVKEISKS